MIVRIVTLAYELPPRLEIVPESKGESDLLRHFAKKRLVCGGAQCRGDTSDNGITGCSLIVHIEGNGEPYDAPKKG